MGWQSQLLFFSFLLAAQFFRKTNGALDSSPSVTHQFSQCMVEKLTQSPYFSAEDKENIVAVANVLQSGLRRVTNTENGVLLNKILLTSFSSSLVDITVDVSSASKNNRIQELMSSVENCSLSAIGTVDEKVLRETRTLTSVLDRAHPHLFDIAIKDPMISQGNMQSPAFQGGQPFIRQQARSSSVSFSPPGLQLPDSVPDAIARILLNAPIFFRVFHTGTSNRDAINIARGITEKSMTGFSTAIINDAINAVVNAVSLRSLGWTTKDFALAISRSVTSVLNYYGMRISAHANRIGNKMILDLQEHFREEIPLPQNSNNPEKTSDYQQRDDVEFRGTPIRELSRTPMREQHFPPASVINQNFNNTDKTQAQVQEQRDITELSKTPAQEQHFSETSAINPVVNQKSFSQPNIRVTNFQAFNTNLKTADTSVDSSKISEEFSAVVLDKDFAMQQSLLMAKNALAQYGPDVTNKAEMEIKQHFDKIPNGSPNEAYANAFSSALISILYSSNLMGVINPEEFAKSMLAFLDKEGNTKSSESYPAQIMPAPVLSDEPRSDIPLRSSNSRAVFINTEEVRATKAPLLPKDDASEVADTGFESDAPLEPGPFIPNNQQFFSESLPQKNEDSINASPTEAPTTDFEMITHSFAENTPISEMFSTTLSVTINDSEEYSDFSATQMYSDFENANTTSNVEGKGELASKSDDYETPDEYESPAKDYEFDDGSITDTTFTKNNQNKSGRSETEKGSSFSTKESSTSTNSQASRNEKSNFEASKSSSSVKLEPSFQPSIEQTFESTEDYEKFSENVTDSPNSELEDPTVVFAREVSSIAIAAVRYIEEGNAVDLNQLCTNLNLLAPIVEIAPLTYCSEVALIDYLLHVLTAVTRILRSV